MNSHCMSTTMSAVCTGSTSSASSVNTCLPSIVIIERSSATVGPVPAWGMDNRPFPSTTG